MFRRMYDRGSIRRELLRGSNVALLGVEHERAGRDEEQESQ